MATPYSVVLVTVPDKRAADSLAEGLVSSRLAACVNVVPGVASIYWWEGKVERSEELLLIIKTRSDLMPELCEHVKKNHPYSVPEVISWPIAEGHPGYLDWLGANARFGRVARENA